MDYSDRNYAIFSTSEIDKIDFTKVMEHSPDTLRTSLDGTLTFVKWEDGGSLTPNFINTMNTIVGIYNYDEIMVILAGPEWTPVATQGLQGLQGIQGIQGIQGV